MSSNNKQKGPPDYRDAETGQFVTEEYARRHPKTTEKEHNRSPPTPRPKSGK